MAITFLKGTSTSYSASGFTPVADVFYFCTDTGDFYLGTQKLTNAADVAAAVESIGQNASDIAEINQKLLKLEGSENTTGSIRNIIRGYLDGEVQQKLDQKVDTVITNNGNRALVFNESDGGGAKFEHADGTLSFVGVNDGGENGMTGQLYSVKQVEGKYVGTRLNMTSDGFFYTNGANSPAYTANDEIATKGDVAAASGSANSKTVYLKDETVAGGSVAKTYVFYQGADTSDMSKNTKLGEINIAKDIYLQKTSIVTVEDGVDSEGDETEVADGVYIKMVMQNQDEPLYLDVLSLVEDFTVQPNATQIQLAISANRELSATIVAGSVGTTELANGAVTADKLAAGAKALFDEAGAADAVLGDPSDGADATTVYGAIAKAQSMELVWGSF